ncbi:MAG: phospholipase [Chitinophagaceae bacterium]|nr:MAG: phospholipase [Chitinophagaceae bacterium]
MPDSLQDALKGHLNDVATDNYVKIYDTPAVWGQPFGKALMAQAEKRADEFESAITDMLKKMRFRCDISSLNAPDAAWRDVLLLAIDSAFTTKLGRTDRTQIRFMLAQTPTVLLKGVPYYFAGTPEYLALKEALAKLVEQRGSEWECVPDIWIGRYYKIADPLQEAIANKAGCEALVAAFDAKMTWNHTKIIAVDGVESFVGGHNLNMDLFRNYPPVHDVSVKVLGKAALAAQQFLNELWIVDSGLLTKEYYDPKSKAWINVIDDKTQPADPLAAKHVTEYREAQYADHKKNPPSQTEFKKSGHILSVGKYWSGPDRQTNYKNGSEVMKEHLIKKAKKIIRLSQQDVVSAWKKNWSEHVVCRWIIEALLANPTLKVQIVVSPLDAGAGAEGDQYSFGSGARRTFELFKYFLTHDPLTDEPIEGSSGLRQAALKRIEVAPFFFTDVSVDLAVEGDTYKWPDQSAEAHTATLKEPPLSARPPVAGVIGYPMHSLIKGSGFLGKVPSAPGNHAKVIIIDDELYVVGSDNLYPGYLAEFNYVIDGPDAVNEFIQSYWNPLWKYSSKHAFNYRNT